MAYFMQYLMLHQSLSLSGVNGKEVEKESHFKTGHFRLGLLQKPLQE